MPGVAPMDVIPKETTVIGTHRNESVAVVLAEGPGYVVFVESWATVTHLGVAASCPTLANEVLDQLDRPEEEPEEATVSVVLWRKKVSGGNSRSDRRLQAKSWDEIKSNYPASVRAQLHDLTSRSGIEDDEGRLILFHGEPGVGKTTAIRALMNEWSPWCETHLVTDPDRLFSESDYLMNVLESGEGQSAPTLDRPPGIAKWKLIVAEDADAYLRSTARRDAGAALGRLLNATDGILGQSIRAVVLLTTNEELTRLHPALVRPGRCLARTEFLKFSPQEALEWLGANGSLPSGESTLAELFESRRTNRPVVANSVLTGSYL